MTALPNNSVGITPEEQQAVDKEWMQQKGFPLADPVSLMPGQPGSVQANSSMEVPDTAVGTDLDDVQQNTKEAKAAVEHWTTVLQQPGLTPEQGQAANRELTKRRGELSQSAHKLILLRLKQLTLGSTQIRTCFPAKCGVTPTVALNNSVLLFCRDRARW